MKKSTCNTLDLPKYSFSKSGVIKNMWAHVAFNAFKVQ